MTQTWTKKTDSNKKKVKWFVETLKIEMSFDVYRDVRFEKVDLDTKIIGATHKHVYLMLKQTEETAIRSGHVQLHPVDWTKEGEAKKSYQMPYLEVDLVSKEDMGQPTGAYKMAEFPYEDASIVPLVPESSRVAMTLLEYTQIENLTNVDISRGENPESVNFCGEQYILYQNTDGLHIVIDRDITIRAIVRHRYRTDIQLLQGDNLIPEDYIYQNPQLIVVGYSKEDLLIINAHCFTPARPSILANFELSENCTCDIVRLDHPAFQCYR